MKALNDTYDKRYLSIAMPAAVESVFMILLSAADLIMVGPLGAGAVAAVSIFLQPRLVLLCFSRSIANALALMVAKKIGAGDKNGVADSFAKSVVLCCVFMGLLHIVFFYFLEDIFLLMGAEADYLAYAMDYGSVATVSVFVTSLTLVMQALQLGFGETAAIMKTNIIGNIVNVICNFILIFGAGPVPALGVTGAAIATVIGALVTLAATVYTMLAAGHLKGFRILMPDAKYFKEFLPVFSSLLSEYGFERIGMVLFARMAAGLGTIPFAVHSICMNICDIYYDFSLGLGKASMVLAGQSCGEKNIEKWKAYKRCGIKWSLIFSTISFVLTLVFKEEIFGIYTNDAAAIALSGTVMVLLALVSYPEAQAIIAAGILRGSGQTAKVAACSFFLITILRPLMTAFFLYYLEMGILGLWVALLTDQTLRAVCFTAMLTRVKRIGE